MTENASLEKLERKGYPLLVWLISQGVRPFRPRDVLAWDEELVQEAGFWYLLWYRLTREPWSWLMYGLAILIWFNAFTLCDWLGLPPMLWRRIYMTGTPLMGLALSVLTIVGVGGGGYWKKSLFVNYPVAFVPVMTLKRIENVFMSSLRPGGTTLYIKRYFLAGRLRGTFLGISAGEEKYLVDAWE